jgi:DNA-binding NarL/FixJ family response regulator
MHILYLTKDLLFSSRVCSLAKQHGATIDVNCVVDADTTEDATLAIIDLSMQQLNVTEVIRLLREKSSELKIIAYGPHVNTDMLTAAEQAGCDMVLPRSQFNQQIGPIIDGS